MNIKKSSLAVAVSALLGLGIAGQASGSVYSGARLLVEDLDINIVPTAGTTGTVTVTSYKFTANASAKLNTLTATTDDNLCSTSASTPDCTAPAPVLDSVANDPTNDPGANRTLGDFSFFGPDGDTYSGAAARINEAQLVTGNDTQAYQISETEIQATGFGEASTEVASETQIAMSFDVTGEADLQLTFTADPNLYVHVDTENWISSLAQAVISASFALTGDNGVDVGWAPDGETDGTENVDFTECTGVTSCTEDNDDESLNETRALPPGNPNDAGFSDDRITWNATLSPDNSYVNFGITITGLTTGGYNLNLGATTFANAEQEVAAVPEPTLLALLGLGFAGVGFSSTRRRKQKIA